MNGYKKEEAKRDICKKHTVRSDRELYRACPSKLSKKELEDLYFTLLEKNLDLKKTVTGQQDQIKLLSTKVQRMTAMQKNNVAREKDCCMYTKALVNEQKESISDLKRANEKMTERIRVLNMRLCSAKQFLRRSPATSTSRCAKCCAPPMSLKNSSVSVIHPKINDNNVKTAVSSQDLDKDVMLSTRTVETETEEPEKENPERLCNENRCQSLMDEFKQKIVDLQEELNRTHTEYSTRITRLESEVTELRAANERERTERAASDHQRQARAQHADQLAARLRDAEGKYGELSTELSIEKRKVAELDTRVKAAARTSDVARTIREHLDNTQIVKKIENQQLEPPASPDISPRWDNSPRLEVFSSSPGQPSDASEARGRRDEAGGERDAQRLSKLSDDSGYIEAYKTPKPDDEKHKNNDSNEELKNRIAHLQQQLNEVMSGIKNGKVPSDNSVSKADDDRFHNTDALSRKVEVPSIKINKTPSDNGLGKSASALKIPSSYFKPKPDDMMELLDTDANSQKTAVTQRMNELNDVSVNPTIYDKRIKNDAGSIDPDIDTPERVSFENKDITPIHLELNNENKTQTKKDNHNHFQIPGPIPTDNVSNVTDRIVDKFRNKSSAVKCKRQSKDTVIRAREVNKLAGFDINYNNRDENVVRIKSDVDEDNLDLKNATTKNNEDVVRNPTEPRDRLSSEKDEVSPVKALNVGSLMEKYIESEMVPSSSTIIPTIPNNANDVQQSKIELCLHQSRVCTCRAATARRRDVAVFRTCSGTLRFRTSPAGPGAPAFRRCVGCAPEDETNVAVAGCPDSVASQDASDAPTPARECRRRSATYSKRQAPPAPPHSPDNTDCEISSLTDLPSERDGKSPREALSLGEEKATSTYSDSYSPRTADYSALSEGELPAGEAQKLSEGEAKVESFDNKHAAAAAGARMEEALAAISDELALCRQLLRAKRPDEPKRASKDAALMTELCPAPAPIALKRASGSPRIGDAHAPKCIFTLHIGTVVLSDEAVINSRNMSLVLTWKFYDQSMTMTRMRAGRVMLFDFSTEYDVKITEQFLDYLKHENMQIIISEIDKQGEPFASCALPLRDALLHTNRRSDMSLALMAGPTLQQTHDPLDSGDEVGVLDLWCMLKVDPSLLPAINRAIARASPPNLTSKDTARASTCLEQLMEDDRYNDDHISQDLNMRPAMRPKTDLYDFGPSTKQDTDIYGFESPQSPNTRKNSDIYDFEPQPNPIAKQRTNLYGVESSLNFNTQQKPDIYDFKAPQNFTNQKADIFDFETPKNPNTKQKSDIYDFIVPDSHDPKRKPNSYDESRPLLPPANFHSATNQGQSSEFTNMSAVRERHRSIASQTGISASQSTNPLRRSVTRSQVGFKDADVQSTNSNIIVNEVPAQIKSAKDMKQALDEILACVILLVINGPEKDAYEMKERVMSNFQRNTLHDQIPPISQLGKIDDDAVSQTHSVGSYWKGLVTKRQKYARSSFSKKDNSVTSLRKKDLPYNTSSKGPVFLTPHSDEEEPPELTKSNRGQNGSKKSVTIATNKDNKKEEYNERDPSDVQMGQSVDITVMWLALNEECDAMQNPNVQRLYVAYTFLGRSGADMETPVSLLKPKSYVDKCYFQFTKIFQLSDCDLPLLGHMARCRSTNRKEHNSKDCAIFTVISEPPEDPLGLDSCEDIGFAYLYFGDLLAYSAGNDSYTEVLPVQSVNPGETVCGVLAVKVDGLDVLRRCTLLATSQRELGFSTY